jgi:hypothetical protein
VEASKELAKEEHIIICVRVRVDLGPFVYCLFSDCGSYVS